MGDENLVNTASSYCQISNRHSQGKENKLTLHPAFTTSSPTCSRKKAGIGRNWIFKVTNFHGNGNLYLTTQEKRV